MDLVRRRARRAMHAQTHGVYGRMRLKEVGDDE